MSKPRLDAIFSPPRVCITLQCLQQIRGYTAVCPAEINGFGLVAKKGNDFWIEEVFILPQVVSGSSAVTDDAAFHQFLYERVRKGLPQLPIGLQWHSHVCMRAQFSSIDLRLIKNYNADWLISLVVNKYGEYQCRLDLYRPFRLGLDVPLHVALPRFSVEDLASLRSEVEAKVRIERQEPRVVSEADYLRQPLTSSALVPLPSLFGEGGVPEDSEEKHA